MNTSRGSPCDARGAGLLAYRHLPEVTGRQPGVLVPVASGLARDDTLCKTWSIPPRGSVSRREAYGLGSRQPAGPVRPSEGPLLNAYNTDGPPAPGVEAQPQKAPGTLRYFIHSAATRPV